MSRLFTLNFEHKARYYDAVVTVCEKELKNISFNVFIYDDEFDHMLPHADGKINIMQSQLYAVETTLNSALDELKQSISKAICLYLQSSRMEWKDLP